MSDLSASDLSASDLSASDLSASRQVMRVAVLNVAVDEAEVAADRMWAAGAQAVEERSVEGRAELLSVLGADDEVVTARLGVLPNDWILRFDEVDATPAETWREYVAPIFIEPDVVLRPAWLAPTGAPIEVAVEPAGSFGLGDHPTTRLCAEAIRRLIAGGETVLDVGCGSGVLSVLAVMCGAATATGIDIAEPAVTATLDNAARNGVGDHVHASTQTLDQIDGTFDVVVANILAPTLRTMAIDLCARVAPGGALILSGLLEAGYEAVTTEFVPFVVERVDTFDGWAAVTLRPPSI